MRLPQPFAPPLRFGQCGVRRGCEQRFGVLERADVHEAAPLVLIGAAAQPRRRPLDLLTQLVRALRRGVVCAGAGVRREIRGGVFDERLYCERVLRATWVSS